MRPRADAPRAGLRVKHSRNARNCGIPVKKYKTQFEANRNKDVEALQKCPWGRALKNALGGKIPKMPPGCELPKCCHMDSYKKFKSQPHSKIQNCRKHCRNLQDGELPKVPQVESCKKSAGAELPQTSEELPNNRVLMNSLRPRADEAPQGLVGKHSGNGRLWRIPAEKTYIKKSNK